MSRPADAGGFSTLRGPDVQFSSKRAKSLQIPGVKYIAPSTDALELHTCGYAKTVASAIFISKLDADVAISSVGYFTGPLEARKKVGEPVVDREKKEVRIAMKNGTVITARYLGSQGCVVLPPGRDDVFFKPTPVRSSLPDPSTVTWPMGDVLPSSGLPKEIDAKKLQQALAAAFDPPEAETCSFVVTYKGRLIGERYRAGITHSTALESWSMGKSITGTLLALLVKDGVYSIDQPAPIPEWQSENDGRKNIRIRDLLNMSSGLLMSTPYDPDDPKDSYPDHVYMFTGREDLFKYAANRPQQFPPGEVGRYRNCDPVLVNYLIRLAVERRGEDYHSFPQRRLFDKLGIRSAVLETDAYGNFLAQGYDLLSARDWARLGNLYLQDGLWNGERLLPEGWTKFATTPAPGWAKDRNPVYGGFLWLNTLEEFPVPKDAYSMQGVAGQHCIVIPSHDLVVTRLGLYKGQHHSKKALERALRLLMETVPRAAHRSAL